MNVAAFRWGRRAAHEPDFVRGLIAGQGCAGRRTDRQTLDEIVARRVEFLTAYQSRRYARRYERRVAANPRGRGEGRCPARPSVTEAVARNLFKLMAVKDEYEVARLYTDGSFERQLDEPVPELRAAGIPSRAADAGPQGPGRQAAQIELRPLDDDRLSRFWRSCGGCAARRSTSSATARSGAWSAACLPSIRAISS